jgi:hypothetical protein
MFLSIPIGCLLYLPFGTKRREDTTPLEFALAMTILIGMFVVFFAMPAIMAIGGRIRMRRLLSKEADDELRHLAGVRRWGLSNLTIVKGPKQGKPQAHLK